VCEGHFIDGRLFFATTPDKPLTGPLQKVVKGWQEGLQLMHAGETWEFVLPPALAYGEKGWHSPSAEIPSIPPQTALLFKIELLAVTQPAPSDGKTP
jgi:FKBP-type peptidyl-prolyl cis-trans isomerase